MLRDYGSVAFRVMKGRFCRRAKDSKRGLKREPYFNLAVYKGRDFEGCHPRRAAHDAFVPGWNSVFAIITLDVPPIRGHKITEPVVEVRHT